jgi:hypothetical protein
MHTRGVYKFRLRRFYFPGVVRGGQARRRETARGARKAFGVRFAVHSGRVVEGDVAHHYDIG